MKAASVSAVTNPCRRDSTVKEPMFATLVWSAVQHLKIDTVEEGWQRHYKEPFKQRHLNQILEICGTFCIFSWTISQILLTFHMISWSQQKVWKGSWPLFVTFVKYNQNNEAVYTEPTFRSFNFTCTNAYRSKLSSVKYFNICITAIGWSIDQILKLEVNTVAYAPLSESSYIVYPIIRQNLKD